MLTILSFLLLALIGAFLVFLFAKQSAQQQKSEQHFTVLQERVQASYQLHEQVTRLLQSQQHAQSEQQLNTLKTLQDSLRETMAETRNQITQTLKQQTDMVDKRVATLTDNTDRQLKFISKQVEERLSEGFAKTTTLFTDVVKRLAMIDVAQKKITELSSNVVSLQEILTDKRSRGTFGEVQLNGLIQNMLPANSYALQHTLANGKRVDCMLWLPEPTGHIAVDAKFPLETYRRINDPSLPAADLKVAEQQFKKDIKKHIQDIASKYIIPGETAEGAVMFIPAEAIFAEIHGHYPDLVEYAQQRNIWLVSPTTMMAILTTARAVLKDAATRQQVHLIQEHLVHLSKDFGRFQQRMDNLARHIQQASQDVELVHKSSQKIAGRFTKIEKVELPDSTAAEWDALINEQND